MRPGSSQGASASSPSPCFAAIDAHGDAAGHLLDLRAPRLEVRGHVGLVQQHHGRGAALPGQHQRALEPARVEVAVEAHHQEHRVDVGRQHLRDRAHARGAADERRAPRQHGLDHVARPAPAAAAAPPSPRPWAAPAAPLAARVRLRAASARLSPAAVSDAQVARVAPDDARGHEALRGEGGEARGVGLAPAQRRESVVRQAGVSRGGGGTRP